MGIEESIILSLKNMCLYTYFISKAHFKDFIGNQQKYIVLPKFDLESEDDFEDVITFHYENKVNVSAKLKWGLPTKHDLRGYILKDIYII